MILTGWKMMMGLLHVTHQGQYAMILAMLCALLVYRLGIFKDYRWHWRCMESSITLCSIMYTICKVERLSRNILNDLPVKVERINKIFSRKAKTSEEAQFYT